MLITYNYQQAATQLGLDNDRWLRRNISRLPHRKLGKQVRFTDEDLQRILTLCHREPDAAEPLAPPAAPAASENPQTLADLKPLPRRRRASA